MNVTLPVPIAKCLSTAVGAYLRWSPLPRGKHRLTRNSTGFLMARAAAGTWVRVSGVSGFEWKLLHGVSCEPLTQRLVRAVLRPGMTVLDVGANIGFFTLLASKLVGPRGAVHAFEATPEVARRLQDNVALNGLQNVTVNSTAVAAAVGEVVLHLNEDSEANSLVAHAADWPAVRVAATTLDAYVAARRVERVDVLKVDVEGAEPLVFEGAAGLLGSAAPPLVILELNPNTLAAAGSSAAETVSRLGDKGYECYGLEQLTAGAGAVWNLVAVHPSHAARYLSVVRRMATVFRPAGS